MSRLKLLFNLSDLDELALDVTRAKLAAPDGETLPFGTTLEQL